MGKLWTERETAELILNYNGILWGLKERLHCRVRRFGKVDYVAPQLMTETFFTEQIEPGMLDAKKAIEEILKSRGLPTPLPTLKLTVITENQMDLMQLGWQAYRDTRIFGLEIAGRPCE